MAQQPAGSSRRPVKMARGINGPHRPPPAAERFRGRATVRSSDVVVSGRHEIEEVLRRPEVYSSAVGRRLGNVRPLSPLELDPLRHAPLRAALEPLFAPLSIAELTKPIRRLAAGLIDGLAAEPEIDFAARFSVPFPALVLMEFLGLPLRDLARFLELRDGVTRPDHVIGRPFGDPEVVAYQVRMVTAVYDYFDRALDERQDERADDLLSRLLAVEVDGRPLRREDLLDLCFTLLVEGVEPVSAALDCTFAFLVDNPDQRAWFMANPRRALEEVLRWATPVRFVARIAAADTELGGCPVSAGQRLFVLLGRANVDRDEWPDADVLRWNRTVNRHLAFGAGAHRCLGSHLARLELCSAVQEWHGRIPDYLMKPGEELELADGVRTAERFPMLLRRWT